MPYFTHSLVLCKYILLTHCAVAAIVSLKIIFFKISQQIAQLNTPFDHYGTVDLSANDDLVVKSRQTEQTFYPVPLGLKQAADSQCDSRCKFRFL